MYFTIMLTVSYFWACELVSSVIPKALAIVIS